MGAPCYSFFWYYNKQLRRFFLLCMSPRNGSKPKRTGYSQPDEQSIAWPTSTSVFFSRLSKQLPSWEAASCIDHRSSILSFVFSLLGPQSHFVDKPLRLWGVYPQHGTAALQGSRELKLAFDTPTPFSWTVTLTDDIFLKSCFKAFLDFEILARPAGTGSTLPRTVFRTSVPIWGHTTQIPSNLSPIVPRTRLQSLRGYAILHTWCIGPFLQYMYGVKGSHIRALL